MKHLDTLLDELQHPVARLLDWCKEDQDRAIVACLMDLLSEAGTRFFDVLSEAYQDYKAFDIASIGMSIIDNLESISEGEKIEIEWWATKLYLPLEHIINDRIEAYNKS